MLAALEECCNEIRAYLWHGVPLTGLSSSITAVGS
jgi:hypothetical protein